LNYFRQLLMFPDEEQVDDELSATVALIPVLQYLASSRRHNIPMSTSLQLQTNSLDYLLQMREMGQYTLPSLSRFLHQYWSNMAAQRGFALRGPQLFREELSRMSIRRGRQAAIKILQIASSAVGMEI